ncbi:hypothetical protein [Mycobacterium parascrofulaceum]|uniref:hypothetical protein n=1 Tax=Mycobacterium parascrofulaceum TaxID=240125 RepID=UPI0005904B0D|nr:hypothetical protein [Mycobacterium parascrofulaceum]OCB56349.1 hypothetical protein A9X02_08765 [Mycobacterium malmoense]
MLFELHRSLLLLRNRARHFLADPDTRGRCAPLVGGVTVVGRRLRKTTINARSGNRVTRP